MEQLPIKNTILWIDLFFSGEQLLVISQMNILENVLFLIGFVILMNVFEVLMVKDV
jgi:hypothetical protein